MFFAIRLVIEAFLHLTSGFHAKVTPVAMECAAQGSSITSRVTRELFAVAET